MKKIFFTLILSTLLVAGAQAQGRPAVGLKAGFNWATVDGKDIEESGFVWGYNVGLLLQTPLAESVYLQPEAIFTLKGTEDTGTEDPLTLMYVEVPVMAKVMFGEAFFLEFGPYAGLLINSKKGNDDVEEDLLKNFDAGVGLGLGYTFGERIMVDARYMYGLTDVYEEDAPAGIPAIEGGNRVIQLSVGYLLGRRR